MKNVPRWDHTQGENCGGIGTRSDEEAGVRCGKHADFGRPKKILDEE